MPLIEITNAYLLRPPLPYYYHHHHHVKYSKISFASSSSVKYSKISFASSSSVKYKFNLPRSRLPFLIKAVDDMEIAGLNPHQHQPGEQPIDEREKLRRLRISKANKGNTPWNKGIKHTPETLHKIKERTRIALQNPEVKIKLTNRGGHALSTENRLKVSARMRKLWEKRRGMKILQDSYCFMWQNLIAEASRQGFIGQEELQWNSYQTLNDQLKQQQLAIVQQRKLMARHPSPLNREKKLQNRFLQNGPIFSSAITLLDSYITCCD